MSVSGRFQRVAPADVERAVKQRVRDVGPGQRGSRSACSAPSKRFPGSIPSRVQRAWPHGLQVVVVEQVAAARWGENGPAQHARRAVRERRAPRAAGARAALRARTATRAVVAQRYLAAQGRLVEAGMRLTALRLDARGAWEFDLANGVTVRLGRRQVDERFDTLHAHRRASSSRSAPDDIAYVDMRYTNGFAIGWRGAARRAPTPTKTVAARWLSGPTGA